MLLLLLRYCICFSDPASLLIHFVSTISMINKGDCNEYDVDAMWILLLLLLSSLVLLVVDLI